MNNKKDDINPTTTCSPPVALPFTIPDELLRNTTPKDVTLATMRAAGSSTRELGASLDTHFTQVARRLKEPKVKAIVEYCHAQLLQHAYKQSVKNIIGVIRDYEAPVSSKAADGKIGGAAFQRKEHGFRASMKMLESIGLLPSAGTQSITIQQFNSTQTVNVSPVVDAALRNTMLSLEGESELSDTSD